MRTSQEIDRYVYAKLGFLARQLHRIAAAVLAEESAAFDDLTGLQYGVLEVVNAIPEIDQIGVCEILGVDRSTLAGVVDRLEEKQLLERVVAAADRRSNTLRLTAGGKRALKGERVAADNTHRRILEPLAPEDRERFVALLTQIVSAHSKYTGITESRKPRTLTPR